MKKSLVIVIAIISFLGGLSVPREMKHSEELTPAQKHCLDTVVDVGGRLLCDYSVTEEKI